MGARKCKICAPPELFTASTNMNQCLGENKYKDPKKLGCVLRKSAKIDKELRRTPVNNLDKSNWAHQNRKAISKISLMLRRPFSYATNFLYDLSFNKGSKDTLIRTKKKLRSCHVPLINFEIGYVYEDIFDGKANLRYPLSRETLKKLLRMMCAAFIEQRQKDNKAERFNIFKLVGLKKAAAKRGAKGCLAGCAPEAIGRRKQNFYTIDGQFSNMLKAENIIGYNWGDVRDVQESGNIFLKNKKRTENNGARGSSSMRASRKDKYSRNSSLHYDVGLDDLSMLSKCDDCDSEKLGETTSFNERYDNLYRNSLRHSTNNDSRRQSIRSVGFGRLLKDINEGTDLSDYLDSLKPKGKRKSTKSTISDIAYHYNKVVDARKSRETYEIPNRLQKNNNDVKYEQSGDYLNDNEANFGENNNEEKKPKGRGKNYYGEQVPVLMHEPFDDTKSWTWIRRHPKQQRITSQGHITGSRIHRYRRQSVDEKFQEAKRRWSLFSTVSRASNISGLSQAMFGP